MYQFKNNEKAQINIQVSDVTCQAKNNIFIGKESGIKSLQLYSDNLCSETVNQINELSKGNFESHILTIQQMSLDDLKHIEWIENIDSITFSFKKEEIRSANVIINSLNIQNYNIGMQINIRPNFNNINTILDAIDEKYKYIIVNMAWDELPDIDKCEQLVFEIKKHKTNSKRQIYLPTGMYEKQHLIDHPCNMYLCSGANCHTAKGNKIRRYFITKDGEIMPEDFTFNNKYSYGNISKVDMQCVINNNQISEDMISLCKRVYPIILNSPCSIIPYKDILTFCSNN